ncbi:hypothetical protein [Paenibacillus sp. GYB003]|uniref:hypothetical protein n=1 Tax=Paenibacillus sp. GYB003 TaxID=2994392 RepID=UPI002F96942D
MKTWTIGIILAGVLLLASGCGARAGAGKSAPPDDAAKAELAGYVAAVAGKTPEFQADRSIAEWSPEGRAIIRELLDGVLPTLAVTGKLPAETKTDWAHVYARYSDDFTLYVPVKSRHPEQRIVARMNGAWYSLSADGKQVARLLDWASTQSIL